MNNDLNQLTQTQLIQPGTSDKLNWPWVQWFNGLNIQISSLFGLVAGLKAGVAAPYSITGLQVYANNAAAIAAGLTVGQLSRAGTDPDTVCVVH